MSKPNKPHKLIESTQLSLNEHRDIDQKIQFETSLSFQSLVILGAATNILGGLLYIWLIYNSFKQSTLFMWYGVLVAANVLNVIWGMCFEYSTITRKELNRCRKGSLCILIFICLTWGSIGILFMSQDMQQQITTIVFLCSVLICFSFSTAIDLMMGIASIFCLLTPTILYHFYLAFHFFYITHSVSHLNQPIPAAFLVLGLFMLIACYAGNKIIIKLFRLSFENALLSKKLETMNASLENRVKKRTEELQNSLKLVTYQATHDLLTELPNQRLLYESIELATERAVKEHHHFAIACFSLNGMMKINDSIGHQAAATIINRIAQRFARAFGADKKYFISLSRQDVFVILIEPIFAESEIDSYTEELFTVLNDPVYVAKQKLKLTGSIGISIFPNSGRDPDTLLTNAETARAVAVRKGGNSICIYDTLINADASRELNIENQLYHAIEKNELQLHYQPFIDLQTGEICGAEALIRWDNPLLGSVPPLDFIPIAETNNMILPIGEWVLQTACHQLKKWHDKGFKQLKISVNLSAKQIVQENLVDSISTILHNLQLDPKFLELELTESEAFKNDAIPVINKFREMGISLAIDDFGTGYSEFSSLKLFKVDKIKIDKIFIQDIDINVDSRNIVCNTIALAHSMNIECLAEGVETPEQIKFLKENGCYVIQGYYFSKPLNKKDFFDFLKKHSKKAEREPG